jgi:tetratricopeptide (TPR) repeat protein
MSNGTNDLVARAKALYAKEFTQDSTREMRAFLEQALGNAGELAPQASAEARALLADVIICRYLNHWDEGGETQLAAAEERIEEALQIAPDTVLAHFAKGFLHRARGQHELALAAFQKTLAYNPSLIPVHVQIGTELLYLGRPQEGLPHIERAIELAPGHPFRSVFHWNMGRILFLLAQYDDAIPWLEKSVSLQKDLWYTRLYLVSAYALTGKASEAKRALDEFNILFPNYTIARAIETEKVDRNPSLFVIVGRRNFHVGLRLAGMPER